VGGADVQLMYFPYAAKRVHAYNPNMKIIAILRNPIDRAYSAYWFNKQRGGETAETFEMALKIESNRRKSNFYEKKSMTYLEHGYYSGQLLRYLELFGKDNVDILLSEDLIYHPEKTIQDILKFIGVEPDVRDIDLNRLYNASSISIFPWLTQIIASRNSQTKRILQRYTPYKLRYFLSKNIMMKLIDKNTKPFHYSPMDQATRRQLLEHFTSYNNELSRLIGRDLSNWV
jgi:hypothetical protein